MSLDTARCHLPEKHRAGRPLPPEPGEACGPPRHAVSPTPVPTPTCPLFCFVSPVLPSSPLSSTFWQIQNGYDEPRTWGIGYQDPSSASTLRDMPTDLQPPPASIGAAPARVQDAAADETTAVPASLQPERDTPAPHGGKPPHGCALWRARPFPWVDAQHRS